MALAAQASAGIAGADFMKTGFLAMRLGLVAFILPYLFVYNPVLLMEGSISNIITAFFTAALGITGFASALNGYLFTMMHMWKRIVLFFGALLLIIPGWQTDVIGFTIMLMISCTQYYSVKKRKENSSIHVQV